jgi:endoglucanase
MLALSFTAVTLLVAKAAATIYYAGVAESGGEFGVYSKSPHSYVPNDVLLKNGR